jgi:NADP-dependent aldehyde dehydrogenase
LRRAGTIGAKPATTMLTPGIHKAYTSGVKRWPAWPA